jgi:hypothetical protein
MSRPFLLLVPALLAFPLEAVAQRIEGIVVVGAGKVAAQKAHVTLLGKRDRAVDSAVTDVFGGFTLQGDKPGKYTILVRRTGYMPITTEVIDLPDGEVLTDTVFLTGRQAEHSVKDVITESMRRVFGSVPLGALNRFVGPEELEGERSRFMNLGDMVRSGKVLGVSVVGIGSNQCLRFAGEGGCAQIFVDGLPVDIRSDIIPVGDVEAVVAVRPMELGMAVTEASRWDNTRFGAVLIYTTRFALR